jgi:hypothetical protein
VAFRFKTNVRRHRRRACDRLHIPTSFEWNQRALFATGGSRNR